MWHPPSLEPNEPMNTLTLVMSKEDFMDRTNKVLGKNAKWEAHVANQIPLPRSSSPYPNDRLNPFEQLEPETEDEIDVNDYSERPANASRPHKPEHDLMTQTSCPSPRNTPIYIVMSVAEQGKLPMRQV